MLRRWRGCGAWRQGPAVLGCLMWRTAGGLRRGVTMAVLRALIAQLGDGEAWT